MTDHPTQRCFIAWIPDPATRTAFSDLQRALRVSRADPAYRWVDVDNLHLTLRFLGDTSEAQRAEITRAMPDIAATHAACAAETGVWQYWPNTREPRVLVLQVDSGGALEALGDASESAARVAGFEPERRPFRAHLTLARIGQLRERPAPLGDLPPRLAFRVDHVALVQSTPHSSGSRYLELARWPLTFDTGPISA